MFFLKKKYGLFSRKIYLLGKVKVDESLLWPSLRSEGEGAFEQKPTIFLEKR